MVDLIKDFKKNFLTIHKNFEKNNIVKKNFDFNKISFDLSKDDKRGHISTNAIFIYLKFTDLDKNEISKILHNELIRLKHIDKVEIAGKGFINVLFKENYLISELKNVYHLKDKFGSSKLGNNKLINIEFISANPTGPLHVAHSRGAVFGDVLSNIYKKIGYNVVKEYYVNDSGKQIEILGESLFLRYKEIVTKKKIKIKINQDFYPGEYLIDIARKIFSQDKDKWIFFDIDKRKSFFKEYATKEILEIIKKDCRDLGIVFDNFISEKEIIKKKYIDSVFKKLKSESLLYEGILEKPKGINDSDWEPRKQLLFKSSMFGDDSDRPFLKSDNNWTYFANDSAYHYNKIKRGFSKLINIWGSDHIGYIKRMKSIVKVLSNNKIDLKINICQLVHLKKDNKPFKMSKRSGNFITINEVINEVGSDCLRFFMLYRKNDTQMDFDLKKVIEKSNDNPIFYVQYAFARSSSILRNSKIILEKTNLDKIDNFDNLIDFISSDEWKIIIKILAWPNIVENSALKEEPHKIIYYLEELSTMFHSFWNKGKDDKSLRFIDSSNVNKTIIKIYWIISMQIVFKSAFKLLGIKPIDHM